MKKYGKTLALVAVALSAALAGGQTTQAGGGEYAAAQTDNSTSAQAATQIPAELAKTLDSKNAKVGEEIVAKTVQDTRLADGTTLPKGTKLMGHVTAVQAKTHDNPNGQVSIVFDHLVAKDGHQVPVHAALLGIREPPRAAPPPMGSGEGMGNPAMSGSSMGGPGMGGPGMSGPGEAGRGGVGGAGTNAPGGGMAGNTNPGMGSGAPGSMGTSASGPGSMPAGSGNPAGSSAAPMGTVGNLPGVTWSNVSASGQPVDPASGTASGVLFDGLGRNVTLQGGTQMVLLVIPQPATPQQ